MSRFKKGDVIFDKEVRAEIMKVYNKHYTLKLLNGDWADEEYSLPCIEIDKEKDIILYVPLTKILKKL